MRNTMLKKFLAVTVLAAFASTVGAIGIGNVNVRSSLGQSLNVEIEILAASPQERESLSVKLGSARDSERSNLPSGAASAGGLRVSIERRANGEPYIRVTSVKPVLEPFVNLVIELSSVSGPVTREFAVLLDPPEYTPPRSVEAAPTPPVVQADINKPLAPPPAPSTQSDYGPIRPGETLSRIAAKVRPQNATLQQTMLGIFRHNPSAFINNNMNLIRAGHRLRIPAADQIAALPQADSAQALRTQTTAWAASRPAAAADAPTTSKPKTPPPPPPSKPAAAPAKAKDGGKPVVKLSSGNPGSKASSIEDRMRMLEEDLAARERALNDANERIKRLEKATAGSTGSPAAGERQK